MYFTQEVEDLKMISIEKKKVLVVHCTQRWASSKTLARWCQRENVLMAQQLYTATNSKSQIRPAAKQSSHDETRCPLMRCHIINSLLSLHK